MRDMFIWVVVVVVTIRARRNLHQMERALRAMYFLISSKSYLHV